ncbi:delta-lactam-biosynthetic de-N-acetylase [Caldalkalibacillus salinus]|uniref:delta-lactam-biosynthetic de-N-acetylase n=1 Tax=Caldalkalibacillus salinus TaxID=2803787 RepID=UPI0019232428|nr:delta-lactam-biosynthetic de-N-acetylase [Caldalkalibacillus salinus]
MKKYVLLVILIPLFLFLSPGFESVGYAHSNQPINWGFKRSTDHQPPSAGQEYEQLLAEHNAFYLGDTDKKDIYLTFDNGYENGFTDDILDVLKEKDVPATFFVTGHFLNEQAPLIKRMVNEGHIVGNHSWGHPNFTKISDERVSEELRKVEQKFEAITGMKGMNYLRPPRGVFSERTLALADQEGYMNVFWSLAYVDWKTDQQKGWKYAHDQIMKQVHPGAVVLLHTVSSDNAEALAQVIDDIKAEGYEFKSLNDLVVEKELGLNSDIFNP